jgi:hypothetical protein
MKYNKAEEDVKMAGLPDRLEYNPELEDSGQCAHCDRFLDENGTDELCGACREDELNAELEAEDKMVNPNRSAMAALTEIMRGL